MERDICESSTTNQQSAVQTQSDQTEQPDHKGDFNGSYVKSQNISKHDDQKYLKDNKYVSNRVRAFIARMAGRALPLKGQIPLVHLQNLETSRVPGTGTWLLETSAWKDWENGQHQIPHISITGDPGIGKSYLAFTAYQHLKAVHSCSPTSQTCVIHYATGPDNSACMSFLFGILEIIGQMADQNNGLRELLEAKVKNDEDYWRICQMEMEGFVQHFFCDLFPENSEYQLFIVIDDIDEVEDDDYKWFVPKLVERIQKERLRIKVLTTSNSNYNSGPSTTVHVRKSDILGDIRLIVSDRLSGNNDVYCRLDRLTSSTRSKLAQNIEENADGLLYVDQMLRFMNNTEEEETATGLIETMPQTTKDLFEVMLERCEWRLPQDFMTRAKMLFIWLIFEWQPLFVKEFSIVADLDKTTETAQFLRVMAQFFDVRRRNSSYDTDPLVTVPEELLAEEYRDPFNSEIYDYPFIQLRHRAIKGFLSRTSRSCFLRLTESEGHRVMFLRYARIIGDVECPETSLYSKATHRLTYHWSSIKLRSHTVEEATEAYHTFYQTIRNKRLAWSIALQYATKGGVDAASGLLKSEVPISRLAFPGDNFDKTWASWSRFAGTLSLPEDESAYWRDKENALQPLWKSFLELWLEAPFARHIIWFYDLTRKFAKRIASSIVLQESGFKKDCQDCPENVRALAKAADVEFDYIAHHAISIALSQCDVPMAIKELDKAIQICDKPALLAQFHAQMTTWHIHMEQWQKALDYADLSINVDRPVMAATEVPEVVPLSSTSFKEEWMDTVNRKLPDADGNLPVHYVRRRYCQALQKKAFAQLNLGSQSDAARTMSEARQTHSDLIAASQLSDEILYYAHEQNAPIDQLLNFEPYYQLLCLTDPLNRKSTARLMCWLAAQTGRIDDVIGIYQSVIKTLDESDASAPIKVQLADIMWQLKQPDDEIKKLLFEVLDSFRELVYRYTEERPDKTSLKALNLTCRILQEEFSASESSQEKARIMEDAKNLPNRSLPASTAMTSSGWIPWRLSVARMLSEVGPGSEYDQAMQEVFAEIMGNLENAHECVNAQNILFLAQVLTMLPPLTHYAELINSAVWYKLETSPSDAPCRTAANNVMDDGEFDLKQKIHSTCDGGCIPIKKFTSWDKRMYQCLACPDSMLCELCHGVRINWNADPDSRGILPSFCCSNGQYLAGPVEGWRGVKDGVLHLDPEVEGGESREIEFRQLLKDIKLAWDKAWEESRNGDCSDDLEFYEATDAVSSLHV